MLERLCRLSSLALFVICLSRSASAEPVCPDPDAEGPAGAAVEASTDECEDSGPWASALLLGTRDDSPRPSQLHPYRGLRAIAHPFKTPKLWAQSQGFHLSRRSALYDVQGGAAIALDERIRFTASYRLSGVDLGLDGDVERADVEPSIQATFVGFSFDF